MITCAKCGERVGVIGTCRGCKRRAKSHTDVPQDGAPTMTSLMQRYTEYNDRLKAAGVEMYSYPCPACEGVIEARRPPKGETWDSMTECPHCKALFMAVYTHGKAVGRIPAMA